VNGGCPVIEQFERLVLRLVRSLHLQFSVGRFCIGQVAMPAPGLPQLFLLLRWRERGAGLAQTRDGEAGADTAPPADARPLNVSVAAQSRRRQGRQVFMGSIKY
jgi:hypothetical protein